MEKRKRRTFTENNTQKKNKAEKRKERNIMKKTFALLCFLCAFIMNATAQTWVGTWATQGGRIKMRSPPKVLTGNFRPSQLSFFLS